MASPRRPRPNSGGQVSSGLTHRARAALAAHLSRLACATAPLRKGRYKFPYGDFQNVHRCGLLAAESRAGQRKYHDIELAVAHLHGMLEALQRSAVTHPQ
jgi:hypothetical protein